MKQQLLKLLTTCCLGLSALTQSIAIGGPKIKSIIRIGGTNIFNKYYKNAYGNPEIGALYHSSFIYNL